jgi:predicted AAA+ superfamily ATPase
MVQEDCGPKPYFYDAEDTMNTYQLRVALASLSVLEHIKSSRITEQLCRVLGGLETSCEEFVGAYGSLVSLTLKEGGVGDLLVRELLQDSNPFAERCRSLPFEKLDPPLLKAADHDCFALCFVFEEMTPQKLLLEGAARWPDMADMIEKLPGFDRGSSFVIKDARALYDFYKRNGYGFFTRAAAFVYRDKAVSEISCPDPVRLTDLKGYVRQKDAILENTRLFLKGREANNILLYGDKGTGKSSTVKAVLNEFKGEGLKLIEIGKKDMADFYHLCQILAPSPFRFILFLDDISFAKEDDSFTTLKALIEGGIAKRPDNVVIYATSNRRHLVGESFSDRQGDDLHVRDTIEAITSLSDRFGIEIVFEAPQRDEYLHIVEALAHESQLVIDAESLLLLAERFALLKGGRSPRTARQFIASLEAKQLTAAALLQA